MVATRGGGDIAAVDVPGPVVIPCVGACGRGIAAAVSGADTALLLPGCIQEIPRIQYLNIVSD